MIWKMTSITIFQSLNGIGIIAVYGDVSEPLITVIPFDPSFFH